MTDLEKDLVIKQLKEQLESYEKTYELNMSYQNELVAENKDLKQQLAFLEDWRATWAPVIRQHQGLD